MKDFNGPNEKQFHCAMSIMPENTSGAKQQSWIYHKLKIWDNVLQMLHIDNLAIARRVIILKRGLSVVAGI